MRFIDNSQIYVDNETVVGDNNTVYGNKNVIEGNNNKIIGNSCRITGNNNSVYGKNCIVKGRNNRQSDNILQNIHTPQPLSNYINRVEVIQQIQLPQSPINYIDNRIVIPQHYSTQSFIDYDNIDVEENQTIEIPNAEPEIECDENQTPCIICTTNQVRTTVLNCGHTNMCITCARTLIENGEYRCPTCKQDINKIIRIYM